MDNGFADIALSDLQALAADMGRERWRVVSDVAQVVANYLRCHPVVTAVRYPGLKNNPLFREAANKLEGGFGPIVDYRTPDGWHRLTCEPCDVKAFILQLEHIL